MSLIKPTRPRWFAVPFLIASSFVLSFAVTAVFYFIFRWAIGEIAAFRCWLACFIVYGAWLSVVLLKDFLHERKNVRNLVPVDGVCDFFGSFIHKPLWNYWCTKEIKTPIGPILVSGHGTCPKQIHKDFWNVIIMQLAELTEAAFDTLFAPDPLRFKEAGIKITPVEIRFKDPVIHVLIIFNVTGFPPGLSAIKPSVIFDKNLKSTTSDWNQDQ